MRVGITLPQFRDDATAAIDVARRAEAAGLDGVFVFDHLWPLHQPERPALHSLTLLSALAVETERVSVGTLVARVGLLPDAVLAHALETIGRIVGDRLIAGVGTGDRHNRDENDAYGVPMASKEERLAALAGVCDRLRSSGVRTWAGGDSPEVRAVAARHADGWNGWGLTPAAFGAGAAEVLAGAARPVEVTWAGQVLIGRTQAQAAEKLARHGNRPRLVHGTLTEVGAHLGQLRAAGASWAIVAPIDVGADTGAVDVVAELADRLRGDR